MEENIGRRIRLLRERSGLTQEDVAEEMNVSRQAVSKWEANLSRPSSENLIRLAHLFKVDLTDIIGAPETEEAPAGEASAEETVEAPKKRRVWPWVVLAIIVCMLVLPAVTFLLYMVNTEADAPGDVSMSAEVEVVETDLPERLYLNAAPYYHAEGYANYGSPADPAVV
ncbi:MAG: helix-turn-helix transcriptional regulator, partial [Oscillibacter sp.]|nr:helix-turn-helix transcriptional regulator [Oscillibacter sp.]